jgi:hypothetical protein
MAFDSFACNSFKFEKRGQLFIGVHNETPSVIAMCISNEDRPPGRSPSAVAFRHSYSPFRENGCNLSGIPLAQDAFLIAGWQTIRP